MLDSRALGGAAAFLNPVYPKSFPDPFVFKFGGEYYAYCTGFAEDGNVFGVLRSRDLVQWVECGGAMEPLESSPPFYWAPEVTYGDGKFYIYYSVGNETLMELRVAVSDRPDGGFVDSGRRLTQEEFAIDAHVFIDTDGQKYLFYATDFLTHTHIGTGTVVDRMIDWYSLEGNPRPVTRAKYNWQVYDPERKEKGGVRWHTVEGPAVLARKGVYYEMFSGGNWQNKTYGVSFAVSDSIIREAEWAQFSDGEHVLPILRTIPDLVVGPGHNCVVRGPNNRELYCVYHRWTEHGRVMAIDRMDFAGTRIFIEGATYTPQMAPFEPLIRERFESEPGDTFEIFGEWTFSGKGAISTSAGRSGIRPRSVPASFHCETTWRCVDPLNPAGEFGLTLDAGSSDATFSISTSAGSMTLGIRDAGKRTTAEIQLPVDFGCSVPHLFVIDVDRRRVRLKIDGVPIGDEFYLANDIASIELFSSDQAVELSSFELTDGFEELFDSDASLDNGWLLEGNVRCVIESGELRIDRPANFSMRRDMESLDFEFAVNLRTTVDRGVVSLVLASKDGEVFRISADCHRKSIRVSDGSVQQLPDAMELSQYHQLRIVKIGGKVFYYFDDACLGVSSVADVEVAPGLSANDAALAIEMIRFTAI